MPRLFSGACGGCVSAVLACNAELVEVVPKDVCYSELRWVGGERGSAEMYPGRDCVGCHLQNDGPQLMLGGTLYPYVITRKDKLFAAQSGEDCFGVEGITVSILDENEVPLLEVVTNRAGNFFVEGNPADLDKPFRIVIEDFQKTPDGSIVSSNVVPMPYAVYYGGCARCHDPNAPALDPEVDSPNPEDLNFRSLSTFVGLPGYYEPENYPVTTVEQELEEIARGKGVE